MPRYKKLVDRRKSYSVITRSSTVECDRWSYWLRRTVYCIATDRCLEWPRLVRMSSYLFTVSYKSVLMPEVCCWRLSAFSRSLSFVTKRHILQQKCPKEWTGSALLTVQLSTPTPILSATLAQHHRRKERRQHHDNSRQYCVQYFTIGYEGVFLLDHGIIVKSQVVFNNTRYTRHLRCLSLHNEWQSPDQLMIFFGLNSRWRLIQY